MKTGYFCRLKNTLYIVVLINVFILFLVFPVESSASLRINEFMASNSSITVNQSGRFDDWIEIHNTSSQTINLSGYYI